MFLHQNRQIPSIKSTERHDERDFEKYPDVDPTQALLKKRERVHLICNEVLTNNFVQYRRQYEEPSKTPSKFVPAFPSIMEGCLEDILEEILSNP